MGKKHKKKQRKSTGVTTVDLRILYEILRDAMDNLDLQDPADHKLMASLMRSDRYLASLIELYEMADDENDL